MDESPEGPSRRQFLARSAAAIGMASVGTTGALAGCMGGSDGSSTDGSETASSNSGGADESGTAGDGTGESEDTVTPTPAGLQLETLSVGGSPGGKIVVNPAGETALLDFFATWCAPCKPQMKELRAVRERFPDLHMLSLTREKEQAVIEDFWKKFEGTWPVAQDPKLQAFRKYDIKRIPTLVVVDPDGNEVWRHSGLAAADSIVEKVTEARA